MSSQLFLRNLVLVLAVFAAGCTSVRDVYDLAGWRDVLKGNGRWIAVKVPDSKLVPGSIVKITEHDGLSWIDSLDSCGVPRALLVAKPANAADQTLVVLGASPRINFSKKVEFGAEAVLNISGVKAGPEFTKVKKVVLTIGDNGGDAVRLLRLQEWIRSNAGSFKKVCLDEFAKPDRYLVAESFRISSATYSLHDETGGKLKLTLPQVGRIIQLEPSVKFSVTADGDLKVDQPMYVAVRQAIVTAGGFETLGTAAAAEKNGDARLDAFNSR